MNFTDPAFKQQGIDNLLKAREVLHKRGIPFFLSNGTLLGAIRDNDLIAHDMDVDVGVRYDDAKGLISCIYGDMIDAGFEHHGIFGVAEAGYQFSFFRGGVKFDIFFYYDEGDTSTMSVWDARGQFKYVFPKIEKLDWFQFLGEGFRKPRNFEAYLIAEYGPEWRTPVEQWDTYASPKNITR